MQGLLFPAIIIGIIVWLGYSIPDPYVTLSVTILLIIVLISITHMGGGYESILPTITFVISVFLLIGLTISHFNKESTDITEKIPTLVIEDKKQNNSNLAETLKQLEQLGIITINKK